MKDSADLRRGRPRDPLIDKRVLDATRSLLAEKGLTGTTIQAVSRLADIRPNAIYRRWPTRLELIEEAIFPGFESLTFEPTGHLENDLTQFVETYRTVLAKPEVLAAVPFLLSRTERADGPRPADHWEWRSVRPLFSAILASASDAEVDRSVDPDDVFDLLVGAILHRTQLLALGLRKGSQDHIVALISRVLRPSPR